MNPAIEQTARNILQTLQRTYGKPLTRIAAAEADFPKLDLAGYRDIRAALEAAGFTYLRDYAVPEINDSPTTLLAPTMLRAFTARDGGMVATYYQKRPRWNRLWSKLWTGIGNLRLIDAPRMFFKTSQAHDCVEFNSEFADGGFVSTSNAEGAESIGMPASLDRKFHPYNTPMETVLADHRARLAAAMQKRGGAAPLPVRSFADLEAQLERENLRKREHRASIGWVTHAELLKMCGGKQALADAVFAEIRTQLRSAAQGSAPPVA